MKLRYLFIIGFIIVFFANCNFAFGQEQKTDIENKIKEYENKLVDLRSQKNTLASQIQYMDTQVYLTELQIEATEGKIEQTQKEIESLSTKIEGLDESLSYLSKLLINKVVEGYKKRTVSFFALFLDSGNAQDLFNRLQYLKTTQNNNQKTLIQVQKTKFNFEDQKKLREEKKIELAKLSETLAQQKNALAIQRSAKQRLLSDTQNNETTYQSLLAQAKAQLAGFKSFILSSGANSIIATNALGTGSDNSYYSQRDERWASQTIGSSSENILNVGCLLTSVSMVLKKNGVDTNPSKIASNSDYFSLNTAFMNYRWRFNPWPGGLSSYQVSTSQIDEELNGGHYVIVGVGECTNGGSHYVVLTKKDGDDYIMHDPIYGPDIKFSSHYSNICSGETFK